MVRTHYLRGAATLAFQAYQYQRRLEEGDDSLNLDFNTGSKAGAAVLTWFLVFVMVFLSAMFSGLTLGLLGLDKTGLRSSWAAVRRRRPMKVIYPMRRR